MRWFCPDGRHAIGAMDRAVGVFAIGHLVIPAFSMSSTVPIVAEAVRT